MQCVLTVNGKRLSKSTLSIPVVSSQESPDGKPSELVWRQRERRLDDQGTKAGPRTITLVCNSVPDFLQPVEINGSRQGGGESMVRREEGICPRSHETEVPLDEAFWVIWME